MGRLHQFTLRLYDGKGSHVSSYVASALVYFVIDQADLFIKIYAALCDED